MDKIQCNSCGETKCSCKNKDFTKAVIEIDNPEQITLMRRVVVPASMGDDTAVPPVVGKYKNVLLYYEANHKSYLYSSDGIPTLLANGLTDYEQAVNLPEINGHTLLGDQSSADLGLQDEIANVEQFARFFDTVADMKASEDLEDGDYARTGGFYTLSDSGSATYKIRELEESEVPDEITVFAITNSNNLVAELVIEKNMVADQFGAKGDGVHDDTDNIQALIDNTYTGFNVHLDTGNKLYKITKTLDLKQKGLIGTGFKVGSNDENGLLFVDSANYTNNSGIVNLGTELKNINIRSESTTLDCIHVTNFSNNIFDSVNIRGFSTQVVIDRGTVASRITNSYFIAYETYAFHVLATTETASTTTWFDKCEFSYANGLALKFERGITEFNFDNIIFEHANGAIQARAYRNCRFNSIWCEQTRDGVVRDWLVNDLSQQIIGCTFTNLRFDAKWTNRASAETPANGDTPGGFTAIDDNICVSNSTGAKLNVNCRGISTKYVDTSNSYQRSLFITTQPNVGTHKIPIRIKAPNNELYYENEDDSGTPIVEKRVISKTGDTVAYASTSTTTRSSKTTYVDPETSTESQYSSVRVFVFNPQHQTVNNGGYSLTKDADNNEFVLSKIAGYTENLHNPSIIVSGIIVGTVLGNNSYPVIPAFKLDEHFAGAYNAYSIASGLHIKFYKLDGTTVMPTSFTLHITEEK